MMNDAELLHIFVEVALGRGRHGDFLKAFADAVSRADGENFALLRPVAQMIIKKYELDRYLDNFKASA
jgi:hypothetical protein